MQLRFGINDSVHYAFGTSRFVCANCLLYNWLLLDNTSGSQRFDTRFKLFDREKSAIMVEKFFHRVIQDFADIKQLCKIL